MRNSKFRFAAMVLSEWFHKLKNMSKTREKHPLSSYSLNTTKKKKTSSEFKSLPHSSSSHLSKGTHTCLESKISSPRNSLHMMQSKRKTVYYKASPSSSCSVTSGFNKNKIRYQQKQDSSKFKLSSSADDIIIKKKKSKETKVLDSMEKACPASNRRDESRKPHHLSVKVKTEEEEDACRVHKKHQKILASSGRRSSTNSPRIKLRVNSPRIQISARRSKSRFQTKQVLESFAVIKSSVDPRKDFRESMVEMIEENKIRASQDLKNLLACYLSLNPKEYHDLITKVFIQVWLEVTKP